MAEQPVPQVSPADVERVIQREFPGIVGARVRALLASYGASDVGAERVRLAALKLAGGDVPRLEREVAAAHVDWRDVVAAAEYPRAMQQAAGLRDLPEHERAELYAADWREYQTWLRSR